MLAKSEKSREYGMFRDADLVVSDENKQKVNGVDLFPCKSDICYPFFIG